MVSLEQMFLLPQHPLPALTLWAFLSQVLYLGPMRSCAAAVGRVVVLMIAFGRWPISHHWRTTSMNPQLRSKLIQALEEIGQRFPNWRFGQLIDNVAGWADVSTWDIEDQQILDAARSYLDNPSVVPDEEPSQVIRDRS